jgi:hypothetical protein
MGTDKVRLREDVITRRGNLVRLARLTPLLREARGQYFSQLFGLSNGQDLVFEEFLQATFFIISSAILYFSYSVLEDKYSDTK